jgi:hypothetical protein
MGFLLRLLLGTVICLSVTILRAQDDDRPKDAEGCKDSPLVMRFPGSIINSCENKGYEQADFPMADNQQKHLKGGSITRGISSPAKAPVKFRYFAIFKGVEKRRVRFRFYDLTKPDRGTQRRHVDIPR